MRSQRPYVRWSRCPASRRLVRPRRTRGRVRSGVATRRLPGLHEAGRFREPRRLQVAHRVVASHAPVPADKSLVAARAIRAPWFARTPDRVRASRSRWSAAPVSPGGGPGHGGSRRHRRRVSVSPSTRCPRCWERRSGRSPEFPQNRTQTRDRKTCSTQISQPRCPTLDAALPRDVDICIVGGGPAGITLARELAVGPTRLATLESGGGGHDESVQDLSASTTGLCLPRR